MRDPRASLAVEVWAERALFVVGLVVLAHPVVSSAFYYTTDGPSHVYNAALIHDVWFSRGEFSGPWVFGPLPVPNWLGHGIMALLLPFLEPPEALKAIHLLCLLGLPLAVRMLVAQRQAGPPWTAHLVFPFIVSTAFISGSYNFHLGLVLILLAMWQWGRIRNTEVGWFEWLGMSMLLVVLYFSHLMPFLFIGVWFVVQLIAEAFQEAQRTGALGRAFRRRWSALMIVSLPALVLMCWYLIGSVGNVAWHGDPPYWLDQLWQPFVIARRGPETVLWAASVLCMAVPLILRRFRLSGSPQIPSGPAGLRADGVFLLLAALLLMTLPDGIGMGSGVLSRLSLLMYPAVVVILPALERRSATLLSLAVLAILITQLAVRSEEQGRLSERLHQCTELISDLGPGSTVAILPFDAWEAHLPEIGFTQSRVIDLSNYELMVPHFALQWDDRHVHQRDHAPSDTLDVLRGLTNIPGHQLRQAGHILVVGGPRDEHGEYLLRLFELEISATHAEVVNRDGFRLLRLK